MLSTDESVSDASTDCVVDAAVIGDTINSRFVFKSNHIFTALFLNSL